MKERPKNPVELLGLCLIAGGICFLALSQIAPSELPSAVDHVGSTAEYMDDLESAKSAAHSAILYSFIGSWAVNIGCFTWIAGLILSIAEILRNKE